MAKYGHGVWYQCLRGRYVLPPSSLSVAIGSRECLVVTGHFWGVRKNAFFHSPPRGLICQACWTFPIWKLGDGVLISAAWRFDLSANGRISICKPPVHAALSRFAALQSFWLMLGALVAKSAVVQRCNRSGFDDSALKMCVRCTFGSGVGLLIAIAFAFPREGLMCFKSPAHCRQVVTWCRGFVHRFCCSLFRL